MAGRIRRTHGLPEVHGAQRLWNVAEAIRRRMNNISTFPGPESLSDQLLMETTLVYFQHIVLQGRATALIVAEVGPAELAYANLRAQYEHFMDFRYLLLGVIQEQRCKALRVHLHAARDVLTYTPTITGTDSSLGDVRKRLEQLEQEDRQLALEVAAEWKGPKPSHWSGKGRLGAIRAVNPDLKGNLNDYKWLSWMAHPVMAPVLGVQSYGKIRHLADPFGDNSTARIICRTATKVILRSWRILNQQSWFQRRRIRARN
jgi:hypothetical protein